MANTPQLQRQPCFSGSAAPLRVRPTASRAGRQAAVQICTAQKNILMLGGTRFIGAYLARQLIEDGHKVTLMTRGKAPITQQIPDDTDSSYAAYKDAVQHAKADRTDADGVKAAIGGQQWDVIYDMNGREASDVEPILAAAGDVGQYIFCSSAGVYKKSPQMPHQEEDETDPNCRHKGKLNTEALLAERGLNWTSVRPVYIYGPLNYNPVEEWFFHRIKAGRPIYVPGSGMQITQLGHVKDLATSFKLILDNEKANGQIYNISGERYVTFNGLAAACAEAAGVDSVDIKNYDPKKIDFGKKKAFPFRDQHFFASIHKAKAELGWEPEFGLVDGLKDSYQKDFGRGNFRKEADFSTDDMIKETFFS